jgi:hypothetical protein
MNMLHIRPTKVASAGSLFGLGFMILFGIGFAILVGNVLVANEAPAAAIGLFALFMLGWLGTATFMLVYHVTNLRRSKGLPLIAIDAEPGSPADVPPPPPDPARHLRELAALKQDGLISEDEFKLKREEILRQKW